MTDYKHVAREWLRGFSAHTGPLVLSSKEWDGYVHSLARLIERECVKAKIDAVAETLAAMQSTMNEIGEELDVACKQAQEADRERD